MSIPQSVSVYLQFARCGFQKLAAYRLANWTGVVVNFFFFLIHAQIYLGFFGARDDVSGWRPEEAVLYFAISESLLAVIGLFASQTALELSERVRTGDVVVDLVRPVRLWLRSLAERFGGALYYLMTRAVVLFGGAALCYGVVPSLSVETSAFPLCLALAIAITSLLAYLASATAFWFEYAHGPIAALGVMLIFFGGMVVPLDFYPAPLRLVADVLPFRGALYTPVALAAGKLSGSALAFGIAHQLVWCSLLVAACHATESRGVRRMVAQGG